MDVEYIKKLESQITNLKQTFTAVSQTPQRKPLTMRRIDIANHHFTGENIFDIHPQISDDLKTNNIKRNSLITKEYSDNTKVSKVLDIFNSPVKFDISKRIAIVSMEMDKFCYKITNMESNFELDFNGFIFEREKSYSFTLIIHGVFFPTKCINVNDQTIRIINSKNGFGKNLVRMNLFIDTDEDMDFTVYANSILFDTNKSDIKEPEEECLISIRSEDKNIDFLNLEAECKHERGASKNFLCSGVDKNIHINSKSLFLKCNVNSIIHGNRIIGKYHIPLCKVEDLE